MIERACVTCGKPAKGSYCPVHQPKPWQTSKRRQRMGMSGGAWATVRRNALKRDHGICYLCDQPGADTADHLLDVAQGGTSRLDNVASCHEDCHRRKHQEPDWARPRVEAALKAIGGWGPPPTPQHPRGPPGWCVARACRDRIRDTWPVSTGSTSL